jgi:hypothetical protein
MDPTACLRRIADCNRFSSAECRTACADLHTWIRRGGFQPDWDAYPLGTKRYERWHENGRPTVR